MKKINILIIFLFACLLTFLVYSKYSYKEKYILVLGDNSLIELDRDNYLSYLYNEYKYVNSKFVFEYKKYNDIENDIRNNYYLYNKGEKIFLNQEIQKSDIIIINANNDEYFSKCNKRTRIINEYNIKKNKEINSVINLINKISDAKIIIIGNYCNKYNKDVSEMQNKLYYGNNYINLNEIYNLNNNFEYSIYNEIKKYLD